MEPVTLSLLIGISGSLIATLIFIGVSEFIRKGFLPWYADKVYRGVRIDGTWIMDTDRSKDEIQVSLTLRQHGEDISGNVVVEVEDSKMAFELIGRIQNMYFAAAAYPVSKRHIDPMTFLLHIDFLKGSLRMQGGMCLAKQAGDVKAYDEQCIIFQDS